MINAIKSYWEKNSASTRRNTESVRGEYLQNGAFVRKAEIPIKQEEDDGDKDAVGRRDGGTK